MWGKDLFTQHTRKELINQRWWSVIGLSEEEREKMLKDLQEERYDDIDESEQETGYIIKCPYCKERVFIQDEDECPACGRALS